VSALAGKPTATAQDHSGLPSISKPACAKAIAHSLAMLADQGTTSIDVRLDAGPMSFASLPDLVLAGMDSVSFLASSTIVLRLPSMDLVVLHQHFLI